ncbi:bifunctional phosphopantothenoylcysteine decarboxylase/phosphopantothenate--cysteine ligase CoaBC [Cocleimonas sp. KMM 6892]|uniref:bifunctional phosphopantothenoylcysteine decarboxylase/phosphopantothenate--cysteine ligase CoaBC n=1 Tax=unclassified Cocleimonas TaxID=2639732 RepID=UPI002DB659A8|nr:MULTISPECIES: bifunctional phosphopantothenoylcysteine decarboxylase/phosphopantothenate--cysteine ligase CoaBC [unclassified Cocleimonas]MEB8433930.1 bifunctional phosphopantothenoylcysteine decarboxylase/phosphopantothenate--cysteine ligase CoaBC [Cocleimonas sp. KMM 6892]MEC4716741.1 bifunctional phosphopantothenoylcysteine decarboxylase/phosphopantothenate--cysteine ligase CoaBC [Cocleimonas sp. KMM 6895]MEC4746104.1 bifunctional phosphopantothenoylcysteine decarboxylase/phosphopantothena
MSFITNKQILIGISGGIAAYKTAELARQLIKNGADVRVCMTKAACEFITPLTLQALTGNPVHTDLLDVDAEAGMGHIELARWADLIMIAPVSADFMARITHGHANDLLSTICLATDAPIHLAPAMNRLMWANAATQHNAQILQSRGMTLHGPAEGEQACGETGAGRMLEPQQLTDILLSLENIEDSKDLTEKPLAGKTVLLTAGPTREAIDPVRYITNRSSGKMGYAIASAAQNMGAKVILVSGPVALEAPNGVERHLVESAKEMHAKTLSLADKADIFIATAAVADYSPANIADQKIKKSEDDLSLKLAYNPDILFDVSHQFPNLFSVGFAAETEHLVEHAKAKMQRKKLDMIVANQVGANKAFDKDTNQVEIILKDDDHDKQISIPEMDKSELAFKIMNVIAENA